MADGVFSTSDANFARDTGTGVALVDFWAEWCGPCQVMIPRLGELASRVSGKAQVFKMNVDENPNTPAQFGIMSIPTLIVFKDGKMVEKVVGVRSVDELETLILKHA